MDIVGDMRRITGLIGKIRSGSGWLSIVIWVVVIAIVLYVLVTLIWFIVTGFEFGEAMPPSRV